MKPDSDAELLLECLHFFANRDRSNAVVHLGKVRYSPITFRLARTLSRRTLPQDGVLVFDRDVAEVMAHDGAYEEDRGR